MTADSDQPSPFAASLLFSYVASFLYDGDAPLAERRAQALAVDQAQLRDLIGDVELRELLDADSMQALERELQRLDPRYRAKSLDGVHDMLLSLGDLRPTNWRHARRDPTSRPWPTISSERDARSRSASAARPATSPSRTRRGIAMPSASRCRPASPSRCSRAAPDPLGNLVKRYARTHAPFGRRGIRRPVRARHGGRRRRRSCAWPVTVSSSRASSRPARTGREWTDTGVLRQLRRRSLAKLRHEIEPVEQAVLGRLDDQLAGRHQAPARRRRAARCHRAAPGRSARRRRSSKRKSFPPGSTRTIPPISTPSHRPARSSGGASSRSARATDASRCIWPISCRVCCRRRPREHRTRMPRETAIVEFLRTRGASYLRPAARRRRRRLPRRHGRGALESRLERRDHQRHVPRASRVHPRARAEAPAAQGRAHGLPVAPPRAAIGRRTLDDRPRRRGRRPRAARPPGRRRGRSSCSPATAS